MVKPASGSPPGGPREPSPSVVLQAGGPQVRFRFPQASYPHAVKVWVMVGARVVGPGHGSSAILATGPDSTSTTDWFPMAGNMRSATVMWSAPIRVPAVYVAVNPRSALPPVVRLPSPSVVPQTAVHAVFR